MSLIMEIPVLAVSRQLEVTDKRLWRIMHHYIGRMLGELDLSQIANVEVDETASRRGQRYVTVFLDMQRQQEPAIFAARGRSKGTIKALEEVRKRERREKAHHKALRWEVLKAWIATT